MAALATPPACLLLALLAGFATLQQGDALHCWVCSSDANEACGDPFNTTTRQYLVTDCDRDRAHSTYLRSPPVCRKYKHRSHKDSDEVIVVRSCAWGNAADTDGPCSESALHFVQHLESCSTCTTDQCNGATSVTALSLIGSLAVALLASKLL